LNIPIAGSSSTPVCRSVWLTVLHNELNPRNPPESASSPQCAAEDHGQTERRERRQWRKERKKRCQLWDTTPWPPSTAPLASLQRPVLNSTDKFETCMNYNTKLRHLSGLASITISKMRRSSQPLHRLIIRRTREIIDRIMSKIDTNKAGTNMTH